jgi:hypothetical protein
MLTIGCQHVPTNLVFTYTARVGGMVIVIVVSRVTCTQWVSVQMVMYLFYINTSSAGFEIRTCVTKNAF